MRGFIEDYDVTFIHCLIFFFDCVSLCFFFFFILLLSHFLIHNSQISK